MKNIQIITILLVSLVVGGWGATSYANQGAWSSGSTYRGNYETNQGDTVSHGMYHGKTQWWRTKFYADGGNIPGDFPPKAGSCAWVPINSLSASEYAGTPNYTWSGWNGELENRTGLVASLPTWRDGVEGIYTMTHNYGGIMPFDKSIQPQLDLAKEYPDIKVGWGITVDKMDQSEWENSLNIVLEGHEIFNNGMSYESTGEQWQMYYPGTTLPKHDITIPEEIRGLTVLGAWGDPATIGTLDPLPESIIIENDLVAITCVPYKTGASPSEIEGSVIDITSKKGEVITLSSGQTFYVEYTNRDLSGLGQNEGFISATSVMWYSPYILDNCGANGWSSTTEGVSADNGAPGFGLEVICAQGWEHSDYKVQLKDAQDSINQHVYNKIYTAGEYFKKGKITEFFGYPYNSYSNSTHDSLELYNYVSTRGGQSSRVTTMGDFFNPYEISFDDFYITRSEWNPSSSGIDYVYPDNPHMVLGMNEMVDEIISQNGYMIRNMTAVADISDNAWYDDVDAPELWPVNSPALGMGGWLGGITKNQLRTHYDYLQTKIDTRKLAVMTPSEVAKYRLTRNAVSSTAISSRGSGVYDLSTTTSHLVPENFRDEISVIISLTEGADSLGVVYKIVDPVWGVSPRRRPRKMNAEGTAWSVSIQPFLGDVEITTNGSWSGQDIVLEGINTVPTFTGTTPQTMVENEELILTLGMVMANDADGDPLTLLVTDNSENYSVSGTTVIPTNSFIGTLTIPLRVTDGIDTTETVNMSVTVEASNWVQTGDIADYLKMMVPTSETNQKVSDQEDVTVSIHLEYTKASPRPQATLSSSIAGTFSQPDAWKVADGGEVVTLTIPQENLLLGENIITLEGKNGSNILGNAICTVTVSEVISCPVTSIAKNSLGEIGEFTVGLTEFGKQYFSGEDVEVSVSKSLTYVVSTTLGYTPDSTHWYLVNSSQDTVLSLDARIMPSSGFSVTKIYDTIILPEDSYDLQITNSGWKSSNLVNIVSQIGDTILTEKVPYGLDSLAKYPIRTGEGNIVASLNSPFNNSSIIFSITAEGDNTSAQVTFRGKTSGKIITSPLCTVTLPYELVTIAENAPFTISGGVVDPAANNLWVWGNYSGVAKWDGSTWETFTKASTSAGLVSNNINTISIANDGAVWIGTDKGISILTGETWSSFLDQLSDSNVTAIEFDGTTAYTYSTAWDTYDGLFWAKGEPAPTNGVTNVVPMASGFNKVSDQYGFDGTMVKQYKLVSPNAPTNISLSSNIIIDSAAAGDFIGTLSSTDINSDETHSYSFVSGDDKFTISNDSLFAKVKLIEDTLALRVKSTDSRGLSFEKDLEVVRKLLISNNILDDMTWKTSTGEAINIIPGQVSITASKTGSLSGILPSGVQLVEGDSLTISVTADSWDAEAYLGDLSGNWWLRWKSIRKGLDQTITLTVSTAAYTWDDYEGKEIDTTISILDINALTFGSWGNPLVVTITEVVINKTLIDPLPLTAPTDITLSNSIIIDSASAGDFIGTLSSTDINIDETHTYTLMSGDDKFKISNDSLFAKVKLTEDSLKVKIKSTDSRGESFAKALVVERTSKIKDIHNSGDWLTISALSSGFRTEDGANSRVENLLKTNDSTTFLLNTMSSVKPAYISPAIAEFSSIKAVIINYRSDAKINIGFTSLPSEHAFLSSYSTTPMEHHSLASTSGEWKEVTVVVADEVADINRLFISLPFDSYVDAEVGIQKLILIGDPVAFAAPTDILLSSNTIVDSATAGDVIGTLSSIDINFDDSHNYTLISGQDEFEIVGDTLKAKVNLIEDTLALRVKSTDSRGLSFEKDLEVVRKVVYSKDIINDMTWEVYDGSISTPVLGEISVNEPKGVSLYGNFPTDLLLADGDVITVSLTTDNVIENPYIGAGNAYLYFDNKPIPVGGGVEQEILFTVSGNAKTLIEQGYEFVEVDTIISIKDINYMVFESTKSPLVMTVTKVIVDILVDPTSLIDTTTTTKSDTTTTVELDSIQITKSEIGTAPELDTVVTATTMDVFTDSLWTITDSLADLVWFAADTAFVKEVVRDSVRSTKVDTLWYVGTEPRDSTTQTTVQGSFITSSLVGTAPKQDTVVTTTVNDTITDSTWNIIDTISNGDTLASSVAVFDIAKVTVKEVSSSNDTLWYVGTEVKDSVTKTTVTDTFVKTELVIRGSVTDTVITETVIDTLTDSTWNRTDTISNSITVGTTGWIFDTAVVTIKPVSETVDTLYFNSGISGDYSGDSTIDVEDFSFVAGFWAASNNGKFTDYSKELAPYSGVFPKVTVAPDSVYDHNDLSMYLRWCYWNDENTVTLSPLPSAPFVRRSRSANIVAETEVVGDSVIITVAGDVENISAVAFDITSDEAVTWGEGSLLKTRGADVLGYTQYKAGISRYSQARLSNNESSVTGNGVLATVTVSLEQFTNGTLAIDYAFIDGNQRVASSGTVEVVIEEAIDETLEEELLFNIYPNPSLAVDRGGEGFVFVANLGEEKVSSLSLKLYNPIGDLQYSVTRSGFVENQTGVFTNRWDGNSLATGSYLAILEVTYQDGRTTQHRSMVGAVQ